MCRTKYETARRRHVCVCSSVVGRYGRLWLAAVWRQRVTASTLSNPEMARQSRPAPINLRLLSRWDMHMHRYEAPEATSTERNAAPDMSSAYDRQQGRPQTLRRSEPNRGLEDHHALRFSESENEIREVEVLMPSKVVGSSCSGLGGAQPVAATQLRLSKSRQP